MKIIYATLFGMSLAGASINLSLAQSKNNTWEGAYIQMGVGYTSFMPNNQSGTSKISRPAGTYNNTSNAKDINGAAANLSAGYNLGISDKFILGIGATYFPGASATSGLSITTYLPANSTSTTTGVYNVRNVYNLFLSPGYAIDKERLAYAKVGYAGATISANAPSGINAFSNQNIKLNGVSMGLGYKQMITESIYLLGEANYAIFSPTNVTVVTNSGAAVNTNIKGNGLDLIVGVGYRF